MTFALTRATIQPMMQRVRGSSGLSLRVWLVVVILLVAHAGAFAQAPSILILNSYHHGFTWSDDIMNGILDGLATRFPVLEPPIEYMDTKRHFDGDHGAFVTGLANLYDLRYEHHEFDLIIASDDNALRFLLSHKDRIFGPTPVVFCGINHLEELNIDRHPEYAGVKEVTDHAATLDVALSLYPDPPQIVVVTDQTTSGAGNRPLIETALRDRALLDRALFVVDDPLMDGTRLRETVAAVPEDGFVLYSDFFVDNHGNSINYEELFPRIASVAAAPIFSHSGFYLGHGSIGGKVISGYQQGVAAAEIALQILDGRAPASIPIMSRGANRLEFDYQQLRRFQIAKSRLPEGSTVINRPSSPWYRFRHQIIAVVTILLVQLVLIAVLVVTTRKRKLVEEELRSSLTQKHALLREVHHRVKNNLQIISSLVRLGAGSASAADSHAFAVNTENRIKALALVHNRLYQEGDFELVDLGDYLQDLCHSVAVALSAQPDTVRFRTGPDGLRVPMDVAIPSGLIVNELVTNALKHAVGTQQLRVSIALDKIDDKTDGSALSLMVQDNGPGGPVVTGSDPAQAAGLGMMLVQSLTEQLHGKLHTESDGGYRCRVVFPVAKPTGTTESTG